MKTRIKEAFGEIRAEDQLKDRTKEFLSCEMQKQKEMHSSKAKRQSQRAYSRWKYGKWISAAACFFFIVLATAGYQFYFSATAVISIDVNPSIELNINRFDTVVSVKAYNEDGQVLTDHLQVRFMKYMDAFRTIVDSDDFAEYRSEEDFVSIAVAGYNEEQEKKILSDMESCTAKEQNMHCYRTDEEEMTAAHEEGLSCGKYRAYLELKELDPEITVDDIRGMSMREIRDRIEALSSGQTESAQSNTPEQENTEQNGNGWKYQGGEDAGEQGKYNGNGQNQEHHHGNHHEE